MKIRFIFRAVEYLIAHLDLHEMDNFILSGIIKFRLREAHSS